MTEQELVNFIKAKLAAENPRELIISDLHTTGEWTSEQITDAFEKVDRERDTLKPRPPLPDSSVWERAKRCNRRSLAWASGIFVLSVFSFSSGRLAGLIELLQDEWVGPFVWLMLGVLGLFSLFVSFENIYLSKKLTHTETTPVRALRFIICTRNIIFVLNVIPYIQILGLLALFFTGWLLLILYVIFLIRSLRSAAVPQSADM